MTAEIAILNRSALALAADSAVTISVGDTRKVYDTAEKLFEFSKNQPIALMIYNNVEFVGVPLDVLIRKFRAEHEHDPPYKSIRDAAVAFLAYLENFEHDLMEEKRYLWAIVRDVLKRLNRDLSNQLQSHLAEFIRGGAKGELPDVESVAIALMKRETEAFKAAPLRGYLSKVSLAAFRKRFSDAMERAFRDVFRNIEFTDDLRAAVTELGYRVMRTRRESALITGLVFGGFAESDMFPTLRSFEIDGVFFGEVKILSTDEIDIDRKTTRAEVVPFAQKEMVERFMYGFDSDLQGNVQEFVSTAIDEILSHVEEGDGEEEMKGALKKVINRRFSEMLGDLKDKSRQELLDIVYFMSKKELADIAYALVEVTSHKRRFTTDEATVGGPIDVAVITKNEGLIWIKRKHYFDQETNQGFLARTFRKGESNDGREKAPVGQEPGR